MSWRVASTFNRRTRDIRAEVNTIVSGGARPDAEEVVGVRWAGTVAPLSQVSVSVIMTCISRRHSRKGVRTYPDPGHHTHDFFRLRSASSFDPSSCVCPQIVLSWSSGKFKHPEVGVIERRMGKNAWSSMDDHGRGREQRSAIDDQSSGIKVTALPMSTQ